MLDMTLVTSFQFLISLPSSLVPRTSFQRRPHRLDLLFEAIEFFAEVVFAEFGFGEFAAEVVAKAPYFPDLVGGNFEGRVVRVEGFQQQVLFLLQLVVSDLEHDAVVLREHDVTLSVLDVEPVLHVFADHPGFVGNGQHGVAAELEHPVLAVVQQDGQLEGRQFLDELRIGIAALITGLRPDRNDFDVFPVLAVDRGRQDAQARAGDVHVVAFLEFGELEVGQFAQVHFHQRVDRQLEVLREPDEHVERRVLDAPVLVAVQSRARYAQFVRDDVLRAVLPLTEDLDVGVEVHGAGVWGFGFPTYVKASAGRRVSRFGL